MAIALFALGARRLASGLGLLALSALILLGFTPLAERFAATLEQRFSPFVENERPIEGVIVLGGGVNLAASASRDRLVLGGAGDRLVAMADLARRYPQATIVFTGGSGYLAGSSRAEADLVESHLATLGLSDGRVLFERESRNTYENATMTRALLASKNLMPKQGAQWVLVTSAWHMPRAMALFRAAGFDLAAYPVDWRTAPDFEGVAADESAAGRLRLFDLAAREWTGLIAARLLGHTQTLLPAP